MGKTVAVIVLLLLIILLYTNTSEKYSNDIVLVENIPKKITQTYHTPGKVPERINELRNKYASEYSYSLYDDEKGLEFLKKHFNDRVIAKYNELSGPHKADLLRYCIIYIEGGVYMDIKTILTRPLHEIINHSVTNNRHKLITVKSANPGTIYQGFFASTKNNPLLLKVIQKVLDTSLEESNNYYHIFTKQFYDIVEEFKDQQDIILFTEKCNNSSSNTLDRYGIHCTVINDNEDRMFDTRDPTYPW